jgi:hypothetical protein
MFSVDPHFRYVIAWELSLVALVAILAVVAILFLVRRLFPHACCQTETCAVHPPNEKREEPHHGHIRRLSRRS